MAGRPSERSSSNWPAVTPPLATPKAHSVVHHGVRLNDEHAWLRQIDRPEVRAHIDAENQYASAMLAPLEPLIEQIAGEIQARLVEDQDSLPWHWAGARIWHRIRTGEQHGRWMRQAKGQAEEVILNVEQLAQGHPALDIGEFELSPDGRLLAYTVDERGDLDHRLRIRRLDDGNGGRAGTHLRWQVRGCAGVAWAEDGEHLFYILQDDARRPFQLWRHRLKGGEPDVLIWEERDERFSLDIGTTRDRQWLMATSASLDRTEVRVLNAHQPRSRWRCLWRRRRGIEAWLDHRAGQWLALVNDRGPNFRLVELDITSSDKTERPALNEWLPHAEDTWIEDVDVFDHGLMLTLRRDAWRQLAWLPLTPGQPIQAEDFARLRAVDLPDPGVQAHLGDNLDPSGLDVRIVTLGMVQPDEILSWKPQEGTWQRLWSAPVKSVDLSTYAWARRQAMAADGTPIPITLAWRRTSTSGNDSEEPPQHRPLLLQGYGAYGISQEPAFSSSRLSLMDRGVIVALAHVRGGSDCGRRWYEAGKLAHKHRSFSDFVTCAQALIAQGWTDAGRIIAEGGSAGGLLVTASAQLDATPFAAVVAEVPFVDVLNTMLDPSLPLTVGEYLEWGDPRRRADFLRIRSWAPYEQIQPGPFPALFMRTSLHDSQVPVWEPLKFAARLRQANRGRADSQPVIVQVEMDQGHAGATGRFDAIRERAQTLAFMLQTWGLAHSTGGL
jgi:oligopeptidase B